jgi:hypothetical protein
MTFANAPNTNSKSSLASSAPTSRAVSLNRSEVWDDACGLAWMLRSLGQKPMRHRRGRTARHELVYFCSEHIENAEAKRLEKRGRALLLCLLCAEAGWLILVNARLRLERAYLKLRLFLRV